MGDMDEFDKYLASEDVNIEADSQNLEYSEPSFSKDSSFKVENVSGITAMGEEGEDEGDANASSLEAKMERLDGLLQENNQDISSFAAASKLSGVEESSSLSSSNLQERFDRLDNLLSSGLNDSAKLEFEQSPGAEEQVPSNYPTSSQQKLDVDMHNTTSATVEANTKSWSQVNRMLESAGFSCVRVADESGPDPESVLVQLRDVISQYEKRGEVIQEMMLQQRTPGASRTSASISEGLKRQVEKLSAENEQLKQQLKAKVEDSILSQQSDSKSKRLEVENANLQQKLKHVEHKVKAKESLVDKFKRKLEAEEERYHSRTAKSQEIFKSIQNRLPKHNSTTDQKIIEVIQHFQTEHGRLETELDEYKRHVRSLTKTVASNDNAQNQALKPAQEEPSKLSSVDAEEASELRKQEENLLAKIAQLETRLKAQVAANHELAEKLDSFKLELASRPTLRNWRELQEERETLEQKLRIAEETAERLELKENNIFVPAKDKNARLKDTRALMHEDKLNHKLGLASRTFQNMPHSVAVQTVRDLCRELTLSDPELLYPAVQKLIWIVKAMPKLETFAKGVSRFVALNTTSDEVAAAIDKDPLGAVLPQIKTWARDARRVESFSKLRRKLADILLTDGEVSLEDRDLDKVDEAEILRVVAELIRMKQSLLGQQAAFAKAGIKIQAGTDELFSQIVKHFQQLFEVKTVQGVLPKMNEIYVFVNEMENFIQILRPLLGLSPKCSLHTIINAIETQLLEQNAPESGAEQLDESAPRYEPTWR